MPTDQPSAAASTAAPITIQKWEGWCSQRPSIEGQPSNTAKPMTGVTNATPEATIKLRDIIDPPGVVAGYGRRNADTLSLSACTPAPLRAALASMCSITFLPNAVSLGSSIG